MAWSMFLDNAWRVRVAGMGYVAGIETERAVNRIEGAGVDREIAEDLLAACEVGFVAAVNEKDGADGDKE